MSTSYRADIDGLRAVAVLAVLVFHGFPARLPGGFVGVDVFFVISGYLITSQIVAALRHGRFDFGDFYLRRARRLLPAFLLVLAACAVAGWTLLLPAQYAALGRDMLAGLTFTSNIVFWSDAGYFDAPSASKPLLHLWSLGIEEQFYLVWPLVLVLAFRRGKAGLMLALGIALSFAANLWLSSRSQGAAFYLPFGRMWELLAGAALVWLRGNWRAAGLPGLALVAGGIVWVREPGFPGAWVLLPVGGAMLLIAAGPASLAGRFLASRPLAAVGRISYPLYLWHWPLLAFARIARGEPLKPGGALGLLVLSFVLATLTYLLVETRMRRLPTLRMSALLGGGAAALVASFAGILLASEGVPQRLPPMVREVSSAFTLDRIALWRDDQCFKGVTGGKFAPECAQPPQPGTPSMVLWGDSHAAALYPGFAKYQRTRPLTVSQFTASSCPPILGHPEPPDVQNCATDNVGIFQRIVAAPPSVVVLAAFWSNYEVELLAPTLRKLKATGTRVVVFGPAPLWKKPLAQRMLQAYERDRVLPTRIMPEDAEEGRGWDAKVRAIAAAAGVDYVSLLDTLCNADGCLARFGVDASSLASFDGSHLNPPAAEAVVNAAGPRLFGGPVLTSSAAASPPRSP